MAASAEPAHDRLPFNRVVQPVQWLWDFEKGVFEIVIPAAWIHDFVIVRKDSSLRIQCSLRKVEGMKIYLNSFEEELCS